MHSAVGMGLSLLIDHRRQVYVRHREALTTAGCLHMILTVRLIGGRCSIEIAMQRVHCCYAGCRHHPLLQFQRSCRALPAAAAAAAAPALPAMLQACTRRPRCPHPMAAARCACCVS